MTTYITPLGSDQILNWALNTSGMWVGLASASYSGGVFAEIPSGIGYSRQYVASWVVVSGVANPASGVNFGTAVNSAWVAETVGIFPDGVNEDPWWAGDLEVSGNVDIGQQGSFATGALTVGWQASGA